MRDYFYGWYFRCQGKEGSIAVIPAVHLSAEKRSCSIQVITQQESLYREFPISRFRIDRKREVMQIGENLFSGKGIRLSFETETAGQVSGILRFGEFAEPGYDIMGPFEFLPGMECRHAVYSMKHTVNGELRVGQQKLSFQNADGYMEGAGKYCLRGRVYLDVWKASADAYRDRQGRGRVRCKIFKDNGYQFLVYFDKL